MVEFDRCGEADSFTEGEKSGDGGDVLEHVCKVIVFLCFDYRNASLSVLLYGLFARKNTGNKRYLG